MCLGITSLHVYRPIVLYITQQGFILKSLSYIIHILKNNTITAVKKIFPIKERKISFVRIACQSFEVEKILPAISFLNKNYDVMVIHSYGTTFRPV